MKDYMILIIFFELIRDMNYCGGLLYEDYVCYGFYYLFIYNIEDRMTLATSKIIILFLLTLLASLHYASTYLLTQLLS